jgi:hypothetical protein
MEILIDRRVQHVFPHVSLPTRTREANGADPLPCLPVSGLVLIERRAVVWKVVGSLAGPEFVSKFRHSTGRVVASQLQCPFRQSPPPHEKCTRLPRSTRGSNCGTMSL